MFRYLTAGFAVALLLGSIAVASAANPRTIQNERGTFIQDQSGVWHQYVPMPQAPALAVARETALDHAKGSIF